MALPTKHLFILMQVPFNLYQSLHQFFAVEYKCENETNLHYIWSKFSMMIKKHQKKHNIQYIICNFLVQIMRKVNAKLTKTF